jgi:hypothetical protein
LKVKTEPMRRERGIKDRHASFEFGSWIVCHVLVLVSNDPDQWLATTRFSTPLGFIASPLHRLVRRFPDLDFHESGIPARSPSTA